MKQDQEAGFHHSAHHLWRVCQEVLFSRRRQPPGRDILPPSANWGSTPPLYTLMIMSTCPGVSSPVRIQTVAVARTRNSN